jgi:hypothetical protein
MGSRTALRLSTGMVVIAAVVGVSAGAAASPQELRLRGAVEVGGRGPDAKRGLTVEAETDRSSLRRVSVSFRKGVAVRLQGREKPYAYAKYYLGQVRDTVEFGGRLLVPAGKVSGRVELLFEPLHNGVTRPAPVKASLRTGRRPSLVITGLPADATEFRLSTLGAGTRATRATFCRDDTVRYSGAMRIGLRSGTVARRDASGSYTCRNLPPVRCKC